jgi:hypothetical protein
MWSIGFLRKASALLSKGKGALKPKVLRWERQRPFEGKRLFESKDGRPF